MSHYYLNDKTLSEELSEYQVNLRNNSFVFYTQAGVFSKNNLDYGSQLLIENITLNEQIKTIIDVGCGYGPIGLALAKDNDLFVYMYDINERAVNLSKLNAKTNKITNVEISVNNLLEGVSVKADLVVTNPPIRTGKQTIFKLYEQAYTVLNQNGSFYCVIQKKQGAPSTYKKLVDLYGNCEIIAKSKGYWVLKANKV